MKKIVLYILVLVILTFIIPFFFTKATIESKAVIGTHLYSDENNIVQQQGSQEEFNEIPQDTSPYYYKDYNTIKLLHTKTNTIEELPLDEYLYGVVSAEMPVDFELEALKAQAVVARTYTIYKIMQNELKHENAHICDDSSCCQAWISKEDRLAKWEENKEEKWNKIVLAVNETKGRIITYEGMPINAFFHSNSGGATEAPIDVWGGTGYPYLQTVETSGEDAYTQYSSEVKMSKEEFISKIRGVYSDFDVNFDDDNCIQIIDYTSGGRVRTIKIGNHNLSGVEVRSIFSLRSANFIVEIEPDNVKFKVIGYGHGVGMSQTGADSLAKQGNNYEDIIKHFYTGIEIVDF